MDDDRLPNETAEAYRRYTIYRDMPSALRNLELIAESQGVKPGTIRNLSARNDWVARAAAWDQRVANERERATLAAAAESAVDVHEATTRLFMTSIHKAQQVVDAIDADTISPQQASVLRAVLTGMSRSVTPEATVTLAAADSVRAERIAELVSRARDT